jgi:SAM-dependent methyltransferase
MMVDVVTRVENCRVCDAEDWLEVISLGDHELANGFLEPGVPVDEPKYPLDVIVCRNCWLMSIRHTIDPDVLFSNYVYVTSDSDLIKNHMARIVSLSASRFGVRPGDLVVELGSNIGTQLGLFQDAGMRVCGVDPAQNLVAIANSRGIESIPDFFGASSAARVEAKHGKAAFILGRQCFAHIDGVHNVLDGVTTVIAPDGVVAIEVPYLVDLLDENQFDTIFHEHLSYYSFGTLRTLFARHGLRMIDVERAPVHGGSIIVFGTPEASPRVAAESVDKLIALEERRGIYSEQAYHDFAESTRQVITEVNSLVKDLAAQGKRVAGYGTPSKGCALLQFCGLNSEDLVYTTDTTPGKQDKLTPGTHVPVWSPEKAKTDPPDYYLLLAWNYAEEIIRKEREFLEQGGKFIVPIPRPRIVSAT